MRVCPPKTKFSAAPEEEIMASIIKAITKYLPDKRVLDEQQRFDDESALAMAEQIIALNVYPNPRRALSGDKALKVLLKYHLLLIFLFRPFRLCFSYFL